MRYLQFFLLFVFVTGILSIVFDDSSSGSHESYSGGKGGGRGNHNHRPPRPSGPARPPRPPPRSRCEGGWTLVQRQSGGWCVRIFQGQTNQPQSEAICAANGARLSGCESQKEREIVAGLGRTYMLTTSSWRQGSLRFGIQRPTVNSPFAPTDGNARGNGGIVWTGGEPTPGNTKWGFNNCVLLWMVEPGVKQVEQRRNAEFFSKVCHMTWDGAFRGFVCGKVAT